MALIESLALSAERHVGRVLAPLTSPLLRRHHDRIVRDAFTADRGTPASWWSDDTRWFPRGTPPRRHNRITPLIDGDAYFSRLYAALTAAEHYVYITGWCLTPSVPLLRGSVDDLVRTRLVEVLSETAARVPVRLLLWGGAPFVIQPTRAAVRATQQIVRDRGSGDLVCALDETASASHCHHQKAIVIDGRLAFVGGMDLTTFAGDRWDVNEHSLRSGVNWHDVELLLEGEAVADVEQNFRQRWMAVTGDAQLPHQEPAGESSWTTSAQVVRTIPRGRYGFAPAGEYGIHHAYLDAIRRARRLIYLETQYLWSPAVVEALIDAMNAQHDGPFRIVVVLPARATSGKWDNDQHVEKLRKADAGRGMCEVYSLYSSGPTTGLSAFGYRPTYVHAKVGLIDDEWVTVGSANLNNRGLVTDSEMNIVAIDERLALDVRCQLWAEHLGTTAEEIARADPVRLIDEEWREAAQRNAETLRRADGPLLSQVHLYESGRMPGAALLDESEALTFEH